MRPQCKRLHIMTANKETNAAIEHAHLEIHILRWIRPAGNDLKSMIGTQEGDKAIQNESPLEIINISNVSNSRAKPYFLFQFFISKIKRPIRIWKISIQLQCAVTTLLPPTFFPHTNSESAFRILPHITGHLCAPGKTHGHGSTSVKTIKETVYVFLHRKYRVILHVVTYASTSFQRSHPHGRNTDAIQNRKRKLNDRKGKQWERSKFE